ncbi:RagB/SusD family nutrient uptake outer membrane protein [Sphingobacterium sp. DK4209]|uniref:RagB/SusD family nutrient uptake outer membrane protein n=1 Tax=Sphingobacterium zhuxiongii TaxID=2662364 RepID=A0A5Q0Q7Y3_9SPHI|nr:MULTISPECIES: RagB/SusD family nutrient uptake outer membrane protein [unclassified Sphingobacterium]MVZ64233.1 RagB/SusD family nutrient uptake outer membrane protein [Sphingobacterium sp. DK4209]QGA25583.1 RagB/SusD family nutrient uptake outer membrane protein [Sphingobacterium sp. dk4302]
MKKKTLYKSIYAHILLLSLWGCASDKLDLYPETNLTAGNFYTSENDLTLAANDVYRQLSRLYNSGGIPDLYGELYSDNVYIKQTTGAHSFGEDINKHSAKSDNGYITTAWNNAYNAIYILNNILDKLNNTSISFADPNLKTRLEAEALTTRAFYYYHLSQAFGAVPFPLKVVTPDESYDYLREDTKVIYQQLIKDLLKAKTALPNSYTGNNIGRLTRSAASAVLAKVYIAAGNKEEAKKELQEIIQSGLYSLDANSDGKINIADYEYIFKASTKNSKESILEIQYLAGQNNVNSTHQTDYAPWDFAFHLPNINTTFRGNGLNTPSNNLIAEYETNDARKNLSLQLGFTNLQTNKFIDFPYTIKFFDPDFLYPGQNVEAIRYADILLLYAELSGEATYLNQVRERAGLAPFGSSDYPNNKYATLSLAIEHERRIELAFEFHRFYDLVRTGRADQVLKANGINTSKLLFPIPLSAIDANPGLTQNP